MLSSQFGRQVARLDRRPCPSASSFRMEEVDLRFDDGASQRLVLKDLRIDGLSPDARRSRPAFICEPQREVRAYRRVLASAPAGAATCHGTVGDASSDGQWLVLERVDGIELCQVGAFPTWELVAAWIGAFHRAFPPAHAAQAAASAGLLVHDEAFYWRWMARALQFTKHDAGAHRVIERIAHDYDAVVRRLCGLPHTVLHGEFYPSNILIDESTDPVRICPVDWEMAAFGPGLIDLASLSTGWKDAERLALLRAYHASHTGQPGVPSETLIADLDCCRLHLAVRMLGWSDDWSPPPQHAFDWLGEAAHAAHALVA
jgi:hypothetical protein